MLTPWRYATLALATVGLTIFAGLVLSHWGDRNPAFGADAVGAMLFSTFATGCAVAASMRAHGPQRVGWLCLAVGFAGWVAGDLFRALAKTGGQTRLPFPSLADVAYLLLPVCVCVAAVFVQSNRSRAGIRLLLDGVIVATSLFVVAWSLGLADLYRSSGVSGLSFAVSVAHPMSDLAIITVFALALWKTPKGRQLSGRLLIAGLVAVGVNGSLFVYLNASHRLDEDALALSWAIGMYLIGAAGLVYQPRSGVELDAKDHPPRVPQWLPYVPVPFALSLGALELWPLGRTGPILIAGLVVIIAAFFRQFSLLAENRRLLATVADMTLRDPLTGLGNRALFTDRLSHAMQLRLRKAWPVAVLLLDLDDFKLVNDSLGHPAGDALLRSVGERIQDGIRPGDTVARLGGDEFAVLIEDDPEIAHAVAQCVVTAFDKPFLIDDREVFVRPSVGIAMAPPTGAADLTADDLFRRADLAMYSAKHDQFSGVREYAAGMRHDATELQLSQRQKPGRRDGVARIKLLGDLRRAIDERKLTLVYQPKISLSSGAVVGVEALVRWPHDELGTLEPADFLPLARQNGLMPALTDLVVSRAIEECAGWYAAGVDIPVAVNLSAPSLNDDALANRIISLLAETGLPARALSVEITEDLLLASVTRTRAVLDRLRENGIRIAIDDFGSGYAAMTYLRDLPVDEIKLDRQFVAPILYDVRSAAIVRSVIELADTFGIACVAEGVEDRATAERLKEYGCGFVQGHYFSPPVPAQAIRLGVWGAHRPHYRFRTAAAARPSSA